MKSLSRVIFSDEFIVSGELVAVIFSFELLVVDEFGLNWFVNDDAV